MDNKQRRKKKLKSARRERAKAGREAARSAAKAERIAKREAEKAERAARRERAKAEREARIKAETAEKERRAAVRESMRPKYPPGCPIEDLIREAGWLAKFLREFEAKTGHHLQENQIRAYRLGMHPRVDTMRDFETYSPGFIARFDQWYYATFKE